MFYNNENFPYSILLVLNTQEYCSDIKRFFKINIKIYSKGSFFI